MPLQVPGGPEMPPEVQGGPERPPASRGREMPKEVLRQRPQNIGASTFDPPFPPLPSLDPGPLLARGGHGVLEETGPGPRGLPRTGSSSRAAFDGPGAKEGAPGSRTRREPPRASFLQDPAFLHGGSGAPPCPDARRAARRKAGRLRPLRLAGPPRAASSLTATTACLRSAFRPYWACCCAPLKAGLTRVQ